MRDAVDTAWLSTFVSNLELHEHALFLSGCWTNKGLLSLTGYIAELPSFVHLFDLHGVADDE